MSEEFPVDESEDQTLVTVGDYSIPAFQLVGHKDDGPAIVVPIRSLGQDRESLDVWLEPIDTQSTLYKIMIPGSWSAKVLIACGDESAKFGWTVIQKSTNTPFATIGFNRIDPEGPSLIKAFLTPLASTARGFSRNPLHLQAQYLLLSFVLTSYHSIMSTHTINDVPFSQKNLATWGKETRETDETLAEAQRLGWNRGEVDLESRMSTKGKVRGVDCVLGVSVSQDGKPEVVLFCR